MMKIVEVRSPTAESPVKSGGVLMQVTRRGFLKAGVAAGAAMVLPSSRLFAQPTSLLQKPIPSSGENVPIIGIGTARRYEEIKTTAEKVPLKETIGRFKEMGGKVIDTSPSYGTAESVVGEIVDELKARDDLFLATKVACAISDERLASDRSSNLLSACAPIRSTCLRYITCATPKLNCVPYGR
jgi:hypothetical protein